MLFIDSHLKSMSTRGIEGDLRLWYYMGLCYSLHFSNDTMIHVIIHKNPERKDLLRNVNFNKGMQRCTRSNLHNVTETCYMKRPIRKRYNHDIS